MAAIAPSRTRPTKIVASATAEERLAEVVSNFSPIGLLYTQDRVIRYANRAVAEMFGYSLAQIEGAQLSLLRGGEADWLDRNCLRALERTGFFQHERTMARLSGELFWCRLIGRSVNVERPRSNIIWNLVELSDRRSLSCLSPREQQIALLICEGKSAKETARDLSLSPRTVETAIARIKRKIHARSSTELINRIRSLP